MQGGHALGVALDALVEGGAYFASASERGEPDGIGTSAVVAAAGTGAAAGQGALPRRVGWSQPWY